MLQAVTDFIDRDAELDLFERMASESGRPISVSIAQGAKSGDDWRVELERFAEASARGVQMRGQVGARAVGLMLGLEATLHPFMFSEPYQAISDRPLAERVAVMRDPELRRKIIDGAKVDDTSLDERVVSRLIFSMTGCWRTMVTLCSINQF